MSKNYTTKQISNIAISYKFSNAQTFSNLQKSVHFYI